MRLTFAALGVCVCVLSGAAGALPPISQLVDERALLVVEVDDFSELAASAERAGLKDLIEHPQVVGFLEAYFADSEDDEGGLDALLERLGMDREELAWPTGGVGLALSLPGSVEEVVQSEDFEESEIAYRFAVFADLGEHAAMYREGIEELVDVALDKGFIEIEEDERVGDARVLTLRSIVRMESDRAFGAYFEKYAEMAEGAETEEDYQALWEWMESNSPQTPFDDLQGVDATISTIFYASEEFAYTWLGDTFVMTNHGESMLDLLDAIEDGLDDAAADAPFYADALDGLAEGAQARAAVNLSAFFGLSLANAAMMADEFDPFSQMQEIGFGLLGVRQMQGLGAALTLDTPEVGELRVRLVAEEKGGWMRLVDLDGEAIEVPAFVPAEASGVAIVRADFSRLIGLAEETIAAIPGEQGDLARAQSQQFMFIARPIVESLGDRMLTWTMAVDEEELAENPMAGTVIAVPVSDAAPLRNALTGFGAMVGLMPREFGGGQVFEGEMMPLAVGLGNGYVVLGATARVEDTLRLAGEPREGGLEANDGYRDAMAAIGDADWVAISYQDTERYFEQMYQMAERFDRQQREWFEDEWDEYRPAWLDKLPEIDVLTGYLGDLAASVSSIDEGFEARVVIVKPE